MCTLLLSATLSLICTCQTSETSKASAGKNDAMQTEVKVNNLLTQVLSDEFAKDREVVVSYVEIPPHQTMPRHWHPGEEFHYYLEGEVTIDLGDGDEINGTPGKVGHVPYKRMHTAITGEKGAKIIVFRVHEKGKPVRYLEDGSTAEQ
jgi:quercetin dioxygenase-like cupin family protein